MANNTENHKAWETNESSRETSETNGRKLTDRNI